LRSAADAGLSGLVELCFAWAEQRVGVRVAPEVADRLAAVFAPFVTTASPELWLEADPQAVTRSPFDPHVPEVSRHPDGSLEILGQGYRVLAPPGRPARIFGIASAQTVAAALRIFLAEHITARGGLLLHSVALAHRGRAALFVGHSGAGKSTLGKWGSEGGLELIADELVAVLPHEAGPRVFGTPWNIGHPRQAKLAFFGTLAHGPSAVLDAIPPSELFRSLLANTLLSDPGDAGRAAVFRQATAIVGQVPAFRLTFAPVDAVAEVIRKALAGAGT
jgi:hypothetical protein